MKSTLKVLIMIAIGIMIFLAVFFGVALMR